MNETRTGSENMCRERRTEKIKIKKKKKKDISSAFQRPLSGGRGKELQENDVSPTALYAETVRKTNAGLKPTV